MNNIHVYIVYFNDMILCKVKSQTDGRRVCVYILHSGVRTAASLHQGTLKAPALREAEGKAEPGATSTPATAPPAHPRHLVFNAIVAFLPWRFSRKDKTDESTLARSRPSHRVPNLRQTARNLKIVQAIIHLFSQSRLYKRTVESM